MKIAGTVIVLGLLTGIIYHLTNDSQTANTKEIGHINPAESRENQTVPEMEARTARHSAE